MDNQFLNMDMENLVRLKSNQKDYLQRVLKLDMCFGFLGYKDKEDIEKIIKEGFYYNSQQNQLNGLAIFWNYYKELNTIGCTS